MGPQTFTNVISGVRVARADALPFLGPDSLPVPAHWVGTSAVPNTELPSDEVDLVIVALARRPNGDYIATAVVRHPLIQAVAGEALAAGDYVGPVLTTLPNGQIRTRYKMVPTDGQIAGRATAAAAGPGALVSIALLERPPQVVTETVSAPLKMLIKPFPPIATGSGLQQPHAFSHQIDVAGHGLPDGEYTVLLQSQVATLTVSGDYQTVTTLATPDTCGPDGPATPTTVSVSGGVLTENPDRAGPNKLALQIVVTPTSDYSAGTTNIAVAGNYLLTFIPVAL